MNALKPNTKVIIDGSEHNFVKDVIEASMNQIVIVDFWATWCAPCKQLGPVLEKVVSDLHAKTKGGVCLVKIDIDKNQALAQQLRVQSVPTVYAFSQGRPVDGFAGVKSETEIRAFLEKLGLKDAAQSVLQALEFAQNAEQMDDEAAAMQAYSLVLDQEPENIKALCGMARLYIRAKNYKTASDFLDLTPKDARDSDIAALRAAIELAKDTPNDEGDIQDLLDQLKTDKNNHEARLALAKAYVAKNMMSEAIDALLYIIAADLTWNNNAAKTYLLTVFSAIGLMSDLAKSGRRRLSALLFT